jgi:hypothetical protein
MNTDRILADSQLCKILEQAIEKLKYEKENVYMSFARQGLFANDSVSVCLRPHSAASGDCNSRLRTTLIQVLCEEITLLEHDICREVAAE